MSPTQHALWWRHSPAPPDRGSSAVAAPPRSTRSPGSLGRRLPGLSRPSTWRPCPERCRLWSSTSLVPAAVGSSPRSPCPKACVASGLTSHRRLSHRVRAMPRTSGPPAMDRISRPADSQEPSTRHRVDGGSEGVLDGFTRHAAFLLVLLSSIVIGIMAADILHPVVSTQYALGVATGIATYVLLLRWGVARWLAALATAPLLWDTHRLAGEHGFLADTGSALGAALLLSTGLLMLFWRLPIHPMGAAVAGVALGAATLLQHASAPIVLVALLGTLLAGAPWRERWANALAVLVGWALVILPWVAWSYIVHGELPLDLARRHPGELLTYQDTGPVLSTVLVGGLVLGMLAASGAGRDRK